MSPSTHGVLCRSPYSAGEKPRILLAGVWVELRSPGCQPRELPGSERSLSSPLLWPSEPLHTQVAQSSKPQSSHLLNGGTSPPSRAVAGRTRPCSSSKALAGCWGDHRAQLSAQDTSCMFWAWWQSSSWLVRVCLQRQPWAGCNLRSVRLQQPRGISASFGPPGPV